MRLAKKDLENRRKERKKLEGTLLNTRRGLMALVGMPTMKLAKGI